MSFRPYVSRTTRILNALRTKPRQLFRDYPEQVFGALTFFLIGNIAAIYKITKYGFGEGILPYYRDYYHVVRPDATVALNWRVPEDYPAPYLTNRETECSATYKRDYGWNCKI